MNQESRLGKGLDSLFGEKKEQSITEEKQEVDKTGEEQGEFQYMPVDSIESNPYQPRKDFPEESLESLAESIENAGVIQPLVITKREEDDSYYLVAGERRLRAAKRVGLEKVPVLKRELESQQLLEVALVENVQRQDLDPIEKAQALDRLYSEFDMNLAQISEVTGLSSSSISNTRRLLDLEEEIQEALRTDQIQAGHARPLLSLSEEATRLRVLEQVVRNDLSVRQTERLVQDWKSEDRQEDGKKEQETSKSDEGLPPYLTSIQEEIESRVGAQVNIQTREEGGKIQIHYASEEELESILSRMGIR